MGDPKFHLLGTHPGSVPRRLNTKLEKLIDEVSIDCDSASDVAMGLCYAIQEHVTFPFRGTVVGEEVVVEGVEEGEGTEVIGLCRRRKRIYRVRLDDIKIRERPRGADWIDAYIQFRRHD